ncbi:hypothetical protein DSECCO2_614650 [anaerobic digester metagenome]
MFFVFIFRYHDHHDILTGCGVAAHRRLDGADGEVLRLVFLHVRTVLVLEHAVGKGRPRSRGDDLLFLGRPAQCVDGVDARSLVVEPAHQELDVVGIIPVLVQVVREQGRCRADRHGLAAAHLKEVALDLEDPDELLRVADAAGGGHADPRRDLVDLLGTLARDHVAHRRPHLGGKNHAFVEDQSYRGCTLHNFLGSIKH